MQIIFDKGTENQRAIAIDFFGENLFRGNLNASWNRQLGAEAAVPNVAALKATPTFSAVEIVDTVGEESFSVGAFRIRENAEAYLEKVQDAGFPEAFVTEVRV